MMRNYSERAVTVNGRKFKIRKIPAAYRYFGRYKKKPRIYVKTPPYVVFDFDTGRYLFQVEPGQLREWLCHFAS